MPASFSGSNHLSTTGIGSGYYATPYTVSAWVKLNGSAVDSGVVTMNRTASANREHTFEIRNTPLIRYGQQAAGGDTDYMVQYSVSYSTSAWFNIIWVINSQSNIDIYYNNDSGLVGASPTFTAEDYVNIDELNIGRIGDSSPSNYMPSGSKIAEVAIWSRAITSGERATLQTSKPTEIAATGRKNYWSLDNVLTDAWGSLTLTNNNSVTVNSTDHPSLSGGGGGSPTLVQVGRGPMRGIMRGVLR